MPVSLKQQCYKHKWVVHTQPPIGRPEQIIEYLARYTYKTAISNGRMKHIDSKKKTVTFSYKEYRHGGVTKLLTLSTQEFIRRFSCIYYLKGLDAYVTMGV